MKLTRLFVCLTLIFVAALVWASLPQVRFYPALFATVEQRYGVEARQRVERWEKLIEENRDKNDWHKLQAANRFFNKLRFADDIDVWQQENYWATPLEFLGRGAGDCEDYAIAKYMTLVAMGVPQQRLRLMYVKALRLNQSHMVLTYTERRGEVPLVLDNLKRDIVPATKRPDLQPVYSFNADGLWMARAKGNGRRLRDSKGMALWDDLLARIENEIN